MMRYEVKVVVAERDYDRICTELALLGSAMHVLHPPRTVQSVYLDTACGEALRDNLAGIGVRSKVRFRWYGDGSAAVAGALEQKRRDNSFGDKAVFSALGLVRVRGRDRHAFVEELRAQLPADAVPLLDGREPAQWIRYRRDYLATADGALRVTLDRDLAAFDQRFGMWLDDRFPTPLPRLCIVEIKADVELRDDVQRWLQRVELRPSKCSKFVMASVPGEAPIASRLEM
ncbi:MAG: VTC domain-containing protein [Planctomycetota bacterium]